VPVTLAVAVFLFACGSSSVHTLVDIGRPGRWVALVVVLALAGWWAREQGRGLAVEPAVAATAAFVVLLAVVSTAWSVDLRQTFERAVTLAVLVLTALLIAQAAAGRRDEIERVFIGLVAGSVLVAVAGLLVLAVSHRDAVELASPELPPRYQGMGQNPNTASLLFAVATPIAVWLVLSARSWRRRLASAAALALLVGSIVASGSHGAVLAAGAGCGVVALLAAARLRTRVAAVATVVAAVGLGLWIETLPQPSRTHAQAAAPVTPLPAPKPGYDDAEINTPLNGELGIPLPGQANPRTLTTSSGRKEAWGGAIRQAEQRPVAGYGFGTEARVFIDRWWTFTGDLPENSYIGIALQLGIAGLVAFGALLAALGRSAFVAVRRAREGVGTASLGVLAAALVAATVQSYIYSVGDIATTTVWFAVFLLASRELVRG